MAEPKIEYGKLSTLIWEPVKAFFIAGFETVWGAFFELWPKLLKTARKEIMEAASAVEADQWDDMLSVWVREGVLTKDAKASLMKLKDVFSPADLVMYFGVMYKLTTTLLGTNMEASANFMRQQINKDQRPNLADYRDVLQAAFVAPEKSGEVREVMKKMGLPDEQIDLVFLSAYRLYNEQEIKDLFLRGILSEADMFMRMRELGYTDTRTKELIQAWEVLPGPQDLFWMVGKEAFEPEIYKRIGLDSEFPTEQLEWLRKQGISEAWAQKYWIAHWDQPSVGQGFEMLHRGVIDQSELDILFKAVEIPPYWRDRLTQIAFKPYTRVDVRRMHDMGVLNDEQLIQAYKDLGFDEEKALGMAQFTVRYNRQNDKDLTKQQIVKSYIDNLISRDDAKKLLLQIDYPDAQAEYMLTYEEFQRDQKYQKSLIKNIGDRFTLNLIDEFEARSKLGQLNLPSVQVEILLDTWKIDRYEDIKVPSKTDLDKFMKAKIIDKDTYRLEMKRLGYSFKYVDWYEKLGAGKK